MRTIQYCFNDRTMWRSHGHSSYCQNVSKRTLRMTEILYIFIGIQYYSWHFMALKTSFISLFFSPDSMFWEDLVVRGQDLTDIPWKTSSQIILYKRSARQYIYHCDYSLRFNSYRTEKCRSKDNVQLCSINFITRLSKKSVIYSFIKKPLISTWWHSKVDRA